MSKTISTTYTGGYTLFSGSQTPFSITTTGKVSNAGIAVYGYATEDWVITNSGVIEQLAGPPGSGGIYLAGRGFVTNNSSGRISGYRAIAIAGAATVVNYGSITGTGTAFPGSGVYLAAGGGVTNTSLARISGYTGIVSDGALTVVNNGVIAGSSAASGIGIELVAGGVVTNQSSGAISGHFGVYGGSLGALTVANMGTISGGADAVLFEPGYADRLVVDPGAVFVGTVNGGNTIGAAHVSTLELGSGITAGTLSGIGIRFINFVQTTIDAGATWTFTGTNTLAAGYTATNAGTINNNGTFAVGGTLINAGDISASSASGIGVDLLTDGVVTNTSSGTISGYAGVYGQYRAIGYVLNYGIIKGATDDYAAAGIELSGGGTVTNFSSGTISGLFGVAGAYGGMTVVNAGTISGSQAAVAFAPGYTNYLIIDPGAVFIGAVHGDNPIGAPQISTLELASAATTGTFSGLGTQFTDFAYGTIDAGANWLLTTANTVVAGATLSNAGTLTEASGDTLSFAGTLINSGWITGGAGADFAASGAGILINDGTVVVANDEFTISGPVEGYGTLDVGSDGTLSLSAGATVSAEQTINFLTASGTLAIESTATGAIAAVIVGFSGSDAIDLTDIQATSYSFDPSNGLLTLYNPADVPVEMLEVGGYFDGNADAFHLTSDGSDGTLITTQAVWTWQGGSADFYAENWSVNVPVGSVVAPQANDQAVISAAGATVGITAADVQDHGALNDLHIGIGSTDAAEPATLAADDETFGGGTTVEAYSGQYAALDFTGPTTLSGDIDLEGSATLSDTESAETGAGNFTITNNGTLVLDGGAITPSIQGTLTNDGEIVAETATLTLDGDVQGDGAILLGGIGNHFVSDSTLVVASGATVGSGQNVVFYDNSSELTIDGPTTANFGATIADFTSGDSIDLPGIIANSVSYDPTTGLVSLFETGTTAAVATLQFQVGEADPNFGVTSSGSGTILYTNRSAGDGGDIALGAGLARETYGVDGTGIKIGILSSSFNLQGEMQTDINNGDLPADTTIVQESENGGSDGLYDEGRGMAELVHRIAPGAQIYFYSAINGETSFATGITTLASLGCNIIVDDVGYSDEPFYQNAGPITTAVESAIASGVSYFTAAGNDGNNFYEQNFTPMTTSLPGGGVETYNDFGGGNPWQSITLPVGATLQMQMQWSQPYALNGNAGSTDTLGLLLYDSSGSLVASATTSADAADPIQFLSYYNDTDSTSFRLAVELIDGPAPSQFKITNNYGSPYYINQANAYTGSGTVQGHAEAPGANVVGAVPYYETPAYGVAPQLEPFSSAGPGEQLFDANGNPVTPTSDGDPTFASVDGIETDAFPFPFFGTSAAAPDAAAVAALMLQANPNLDPGDVTNLLNDSAIAMNNTNAGAGLIQAPSAVEFAQTGTITYQADGNTTLWGTHLGDVFLAGANTETFMFDGGTNVLTVPDAGALADDTIGSFTAQDSIDLLDLTATHATLNGDVLNVTDGGPTDVAEFTLPGVSPLAHFTVTPSGENSLITSACFAAGTRIRTERGDVAVEDLALGDWVITLAGGSRPIRWIGHRRIDIARHPEPRRVQPIRFLAGSLAEGAPRRDLYLSPDHALLLDGLLVPARLLLNGASIRRDVTRRSVTYYHIELDAHDILLAEGAAAESYLDTGNRGMFENGGQPLVLHPDLFNDPSRRVADSCAPFADDPARVEPIWRARAARAAGLGCSLPPAQDTTDEPALCIMVDGTLMPPLSRTQGRYVFAVPRTDALVRLVSRSAVATDTHPWVSDDRRLGVLLRRLTVHRDGVALPIPLDHPGLSCGWWQVEHHGPGTLCRWTDGDAVVPLPTAAPGPCLLEVEVVGTVAFPVEAEQTVSLHRPRPGSVSRSWI